MTRPYFCCYLSWRRAIRKLSDAECGRLFKALLDYSTGDTLINLQGREEVAFEIMADQIDRDNQAYEGKCRQNRENGSKANKQTANDRKRTLPNATERYRTLPNGGQEKEKGKEEEKGKDAAVAAYAREGLGDDDQGILVAAKKAGFPDDDMTMDKLASLTAEHEKDAVLSAIDIANDRGKPNIGYLMGVLNRDGGKRLDQPKAVPSAGPVGKTVREQRYDQREYQEDGSLPTWMRERLEAEGGIS